MIRLLIVSLSTALACLALPASADEGTAAAPSGPAAVIASPPVTRAEARKLVRAPKRSTSLGGTSRGRLVGAAELPLKGSGYAVFPNMRSRKTNFATVELVDLMKRATRAVAKQFRGSVIGVGNLGARDGGKIRWSVSHQSGRDIDLGMYALNARGRRVQLESMVDFEADGWDAKHRYRFDVERNLAFVTALVTDEAVAVQYIFIADWLKQLMLAHARETEVDAQTVARLEAVLHQPSDSNPHADHYHVRVYCTVQDRLHGCLNWGPERDWVDLGDDAFAAHVRSLIAVVDLDDDRLASQAVTKLGDLRAQAALPRLVTALNDDRRRVRKRALTALRAIADADALDGIVDALGETTDGAWAGELFRALLQLPTAGIAQVAARVIETPDSVFHPKAWKRARVGALKDAARMLARHGRKAAVPVLLPLLEDRDKALRLAAHEALTRITNQRVDGRRLKSSRAKRRQAVARRWADFWRDHQDDSWLQWMRLGFEARGFKFRGKMVSRAGAQVLIEAIRHRDLDVSHNAVRVLAEMTGHDVDPRWRSPKNNQRHWRHWWKQHGDSVALRQ